MNETTPPPGPPSGTPEDRPSGLDQFFSWIRGLGIVRGNERWLTGVAGGIAAKAGIDPLIVRGVFVVLAILGGPGLLLYLAGWLLLPDTTGRIHAEEVLRGRASTGVIVTAVILGAFLLIPVMFGLLPGLFAGPFAWDAWGFLPSWLTLTLGIIWWAVIVPGLIIWFIVWVSSGGLSRVQNPRAGRAPNEQSTNAPAQEQGGAASFVASPTGPAEGTTGSGTATPPGDWSERFSQKAEAWGEKVETKSTEWGERVEQKSQEWQRQAEEHYEMRKLGAAQLLITLALALLAAGAVAAWGLFMPVSTTTALTAALIAAVAVLGLSMIVAGLRGRNSGWVGFLSFVGVVALLFAPFSGIAPDRTEFVPFGNVNMLPQDSGADRGVVVIAGNSTIDLSELTSQAEPRTIEVWLLAGNVTVRLPELHPTSVQVSLLAGNVRDQRLSDEERRQGGIFVSRTVESAIAGHDASEITQVRVRQLAGNVYIEGAASAYHWQESYERDQQRQLEIEQLRKQIEELENAR